MSIFKFKGKIEQGREENPFERDVEAETESHAEDILYSTLGSEHGVSRSKIEIIEVEKVEE